MEPNTVRFDDLTEYQLAMLDLLGSPPEIHSRVRMEYYITPDAHELPFDPYIGAYVCPVVTVLGTPRMILPRGDIQTVDLAHIEKLEQREAEKSAAAARVAELAALGIPMIPAHKPN